MNDPMLVAQQNVQVPSAIVGKQPTTVIGFRLIPLPCRKIYLNDVCYWGEVEVTDPLYETYQKVTEAIKEAKGSPLMVAQ